MLRRPAKPPLLTNAMASPPLHRPRFQPHNLCLSQDGSTLRKELQAAFDSYNRSFRGKLIQYQKDLAERVLNMHGNSFPFDSLKTNARILSRKACYHSPEYDPLDIALGNQQYLFVYLSCEKIQELHLNRPFMVGTEAVLATSLQPFRNDLSRGEMMRVHNLAWPCRQTEESDMDCFAAIFPSTLFVPWCEERATDIAGTEVLSPFLIRQGTTRRPYDVVAFGFTQFADNAAAMPLLARASSFLDLSLGPPVSAKDDDATDGDVATTPRMMGSTA